MTFLSYFFGLNQGEDQESYCLDSKDERQYQVRLYQGKETAGISRIFDFVKIFKNFGIFAKI